MARDTDEGPGENIGRPAVYLRLAAVMDSDLWTLFQWNRLLRETAGGVVEGRWRDGGGGSHRPNAYFTAAADTACKNKAI